MKLMREMFWEDFSGRRDKELASMVDVKKEFVDVFPGVKKDFCSTNLARGEFDGSETTISVHFLCFNLRRKDDKKIIK